MKPDESHLVNGMKIWKRIGNTNTLLFSLIALKGAGRRRTQPLDDLRNRRKIWELKEEAEDRKRWTRKFITRT